MKEIAIIGGIISGIVILGGLILGIYSSLKDKQDTPGHLIAAIVIVVILASLFGTI